MAQARQKTRTLRHDLDDYEVPLADLLAAVGVPAQDIVAGDVWRVRVSGDTVTITRHHTPELNPTSRLA